MSAPVLKPCPFCGEELRHSGHIAYCDTAGCFLHSSAIGTDVPRSVRAWNTRADYAAAVEAAVLAERESIAKWHECNATIYEVTAAKLTGANRDSFEGYARKHREYAEAIRARGPTDAIGAALAKAREDALREAELAARSLGESYSKDSNKWPQMHHCAAAAQAVEAAIRAAKDQPA